jgi:SAM-dependent methyltransferase
MTYPIPPERLLEQAIGSKAPESYHYGGHATAVGIQKFVHLIGGSFRNTEHILDFGCGSGRVLTWLHDLYPGCHFYGTDINREAVDWCAKNIPFARFSVNDRLPLLDFPDESFDLIYGISVLTHLNEKYQYAWLKELQRIAKPGAIVILTVHGDHKAHMDLDDKEYLQFRSNGFLYKQIVEKGGLHGLPEFYQATYHSREYVESIWSRFFKVSVYARHGPMWLQDLVLMEKTDQESRRPNHEGQPSYIYLDLPICFLDTPNFCALSNNDQVPVSGWAFHPDGGSINLDLWIDDKRLGSCIADIPRRNVADAFPKNESAQCSGFSTTISTRNVNKGPHVLWVSARTNLIPTMVTRFLKA